MAEAQDDLTARLRRGGEYIRTKIRRAGTAEDEPPNRPRPDHRRRRRERPGVFAVTTRNRSMTV